MSKGKREYREKRRKKKKDKLSNNNIRKSNVSSNWLTFITKDGKGIKSDTEHVIVKKVKSLTTSKTENDPIVTKVLALDCEMVADMDGKNMIGRVSVVNYKLQCLYDKFVKPTVPVGDYRTRFSGIRESDLENGVDFDVVHREVKNLLQNKILVGHALGNDFRVLKFGHRRKLIRDTSKYEKFREINNGKSPSLKKLAKQLLGENIQVGEHSSVEDAKTAMKLYIKFKREWEASLLKTNYKKNFKNKS